MLSGDRAALYSRESKSGIAVSDEALAAWEAAKGKDGAAWVACKYDPAAKDKVTFAASGDGGFAELHAFVAGNEGEVIYGALPFFVDGKRKFSFVTVVGSGVGGMKKARVGMHKNGVYAAFDGVSILPSQEDRQLAFLSLARCHSCPAAYGTALRSCAS